MTTNYGDRLLSVALDARAAFEKHKEPFTEYSRQDGSAEFLGAYATVRYLGGEVETHLVVGVNLADFTVCIVGDDGGRTRLSLLDLESVNIAERGRR